MPVLTGKRNERDRRLNGQNILIKNAHFYDAPYSERKDVAIRDGKIAHVGEAPADFAADTVIDASHKTIMPGFVNCHTHAYMTLFRGYADDLPFHTWLFDRILPIEDSLTGEEAYWGTILAYAEMIRSGTTSMVDMHMFPKTVVRAAKDTGMRTVLTRGITGSDRRDPGAQRRIGEMLAEKEYAEEIGADATFMFGPHAIYTCGEDLLKYIAELSGETGLPVHLHLAETKKEFDDCLAEHGKTTVSYLADTGLLERPILLAHCVYLTDEDIALLARPNVSVATNPASNAKLANGFAPVAKMLKAGVRVCLGTDGASSNNSLNMISEMRLLSLLQKGETKDALALTAPETMKIAVRNGYEAAGLAQRCGRIEEGYEADLILIDEDAPHLLPQFDFRAAFTYAANGSEVTDSIIHGKLIMRDRVLLTIDEERMRSEIAKIIKRF